MRLNVIKVYLKKEFIELIRTKMIFFIYIVPIMILLLFGFGIRLEVTHAKTIIIDQEHNKFSREIIDKFSHTKYFDTKVLNISDNKALKLMQEGKADIVIFISKEIAVFIDGSFPLRAQTLEGYVQKVLTSGVPFKIKMEVRNFFNESLNDFNAIVPGVLGIIFLVAPALFSSLLIVKEKETGTIFNFYSSSVKKSEFLIAKLTPIFLLYSINIFIMLLIVFYVFHLPFRGSFLLYFITNEIYILVSLGFGLLVSIITSSQIAALVIVIIITIIPGFLYSGIMMPISSMTGESLIEAHIFPVMYFNHIMYDSFLVGNGFKSLKNIEYLFILCGYAFFMLLFGSILLKKAVK